MDKESLFVGRRTELAGWRGILAEPNGQTVLVVGHPGMGKTWLLDEMARLAREHPTLKCGAVRYEVTPNDTADSVMELMIDQAFEAAEVVEGSLDATPKRLAQWRTLLNFLGSASAAAVSAMTGVPVIGGNLGDLAMSLRRDPHQRTRDQFLDRLHLISERMPDDGRAIFIIDPEKYMQRDSDQDWAIIVKQLPSKVKLVFAQRCEDQLVKSALVARIWRQGRVVHIPDGQLGDLDEEAVDELVRLRAVEMGEDELTLRKAVARYKGHPYAVPAALDLVAAGTGIDDLPTDPPPACIAEAQWKGIKQGGTAGHLAPQAISLFEAYAVIGVPAPDDVVEFVAGITRRERVALMADPFLGKLIRLEEGEARIYHAILADYIREEMTEDEAQPYHERAIKELRERLTQASQDKTAPNDLAARRLAVHVRALEGDAAFTRCLIDECAKALLQLGRHGHLEELIRIAITCPQTPDALAVLRGTLAIIHLAFGRIEEALHEANGALALHKSLDQLEGMANQYGTIGKVLETRGELKKAKEMQTKTVELFRELGLQEKEATALGHLGNILQTSDDLGGAREVFSKALTIFETVGCKEGMADQYGNLGIILARMREVEAAEKMYREALRLNEELGRREGMATQYGNLAVLLVGRGDLAQARKMHTQSLAINKEMGNPVGIAANYGNLGCSHLTLGQLDQAETMFQKALEINEGLGRRHGVAIQYANLGIIHERRGDLARAKALWAKSRDLFEQTGSPQKRRQLQHWIEQGQSGSPDPNKL